jgi:hypothetical protein
MKLTRPQQIWLLIFIVSLGVAYVIANWRYESELNSLTEMFEKEQALHSSADKLMKNCEKNAMNQPEAYDATHQICNQGNDIHTRTEQAIADLEKAKAANEMKRYGSFAMVVLLFNLFVFALYKTSLYLKREVD